MMRAALPIILGLSVLLQSCSDRPAASPRLFPLNSGWKWEYEMTTRTDLGAVKERFSVENTGRKDYGAGLEGWERRNSLGNAYLFRVDETGTYRIGVRNELEDTPRADGDKPRRFVIKEPLKVGSSWTVASLPFLLRRSFDWPHELKHSKTITLNFEVESLNASVTVAAGSFKDCALLVGRHMLRLYVDPMVGFQDIPIVQKEWYCPEVGLVKFERSEQISSKYHSGGSQTFELVALSR